MTTFIPTTDRPCLQTRIETATEGHPVHDAWAARLAAPRPGPPTPAEAHNRAQLAVLERHVFGRVRTPALR